MRTVLLLTNALLLSGLLVAPVWADVNVSVQLAYPAAPAPVVIVPQPSPYGYPPIYGAPPVYFGTWWDPDHRAIRYNRYFERYQEPPRIWGFTLPR